MKKNSYIFHLFIFVTCVFLAKIKIFVFVIVLSSIYLAHYKSGLLMLYVIYIVHEQLKQYM